jgi:hypothetical protein
MKREENPYEAAPFIRRFRSLVIAFILGAFSAGCLAGFLVHRQQSGTIGELDKRYAEHQRNADEAIRGLESKLERERALNKRARELVDGASVAAARNVRNLQDALVLVKEIRSQIKVLEDFYHNRDTGDAD